MAVRARLRGTVDRIEDGRFAVVVLRGGLGTITLPVKAFSKRPREGQAFDIVWTENRADEAKLRREVAGLQRALLKQSRRKK